MSDFNLSSKIISLGNIPVDDVKEFIELLKINSWCNKCGVGYRYKDHIPNCKHEWILKIVDIRRLAGDDLI